MFDTLKLIGELGMEKNNKIAIEILEGNHLEHFKIAKDFALILPIENSKRKKIEKSLNELTDKIQKIKNGNTNKK